MRLQREGSKKSTPGVEFSADSLSFIHSGPVTQIREDSNSTSRLTSEQKDHLALAISSWLELFPHLEIPESDAVTLAARVRSEPLMHGLDRQLTETRTVARKTMHYHGEQIGPCRVDETNCDAWSFSVPLRADFAADKLSVLIPESRSLVDCRKCHTKGVVTCGVCSGRKQVRCKRCSGSGQAPHSDCRGRGYQDQSYTEKEKCGACNGGNTQALIELMGGAAPPCTNCWNTGVVDVTKTRQIKCSCGNGKVSCRTCNTTGNVSCDNCSGKGNLKCTDCVGQGRLVSALQMTIQRTPSWRSLGVCANGRTLANVQSVLFEGSGQADSAPWANALDEAIFGLPVVASDHPGQGQRVTPGWVSGNSKAFAQIHGLDRATADELRTTGISHGTIAALILSPLLRIASVDGEIDEAEVSWILGLCPEDQPEFCKAMRLVLKWWVKAPAIPHLFFVWLSTMAHIRMLCSEVVVEALLARIVALGKRLASASGETHEVKHVSKTEKSAIASITRSPLRPFEEAFGCREVVRSVADLAPAFTSLGDVFEANQPVSKTRRVVHRRLSGVWDFVWTIRYKASGVVRDGESAEFALKPVPYVARVVSGGRFVLPHTSPATTATRTLVGIAVEHVRAGEDREAAETAVAVREMGFCDPLCLREYRKLLTHMPSGFEDYVDAVAASNAALPVKLGISIGVVVVASVPTLVTGNMWFLVAGGVLGMVTACVFMYRNQRI